MTESLSARAYASAMSMWQSNTSRMAKPQPEDFAHLDGAASPASPAAAVEAVPGPPGWDMSAFEALPPEVRAGIQAGTAHGLGRTMLELEAENELARPADVHLHLTDPAKYVDSAGRVDREAIREDLQQLTTGRPELSRYGHGPGQLGARPDERRQAPATLPIGSRPGPASGPDVAGTLARMQSLTGVKFAEAPGGDAA